MDYQQYIRAELLILIPVMYIIGMGLKKSKTADRHIPLIEELISRETHPAPTFKLNPEIKNFYDFTTKDIMIENYVTGPQIKNIPIAV